MSSETVADFGCDAQAPRRPWQLMPVRIFPEGADPLTPQAQACWIWALLAIGLAARAVRFLLQFPLWEDEAMLATNYLEGSYLKLLEPLNYCQVGPPLYLWGQLALVKLAGFTEYTLRATAFLSGIGGLLLFRHLAGRLLQGTALVLAVGLFCVSYPGIRYAAEAKPYGSDLLVALVMMTLLVEWWRRPEQTRWLWALAAIVGPAVGYCFPAVFVGGGASLVVAYLLWRSGDRRGWWPWVVYNVLLLGSFAALIVVSRALVGDAVQDRMVEEHWRTAFPPLTQPLQFAKWLLAVHASDVLAYPVGGGNGGSALSFLCWVAGIVVLWRGRQRILLAVCLLPLALNFVAAALHRYPYGGHVKLQFYLAPAFCVLMGAGIAALIAWRQRRPQASRTVLVCVLGVFVAIAAGSVLRDLTHPYKSGTTLRARDFARWFWRDLAQDGELVCLETDLKENLSPGTYNWGWSALYLCNQRIYSPRHARGEPPQWERVSAEWPLRCVLFRSSTEERDHKAFDRWLHEMEGRYELVARDTYPFAIYDKRERELRGVDHIEVVKFVPKSTPAGSIVAGKPQHPVPR